MSLINKVKGLIGAVDSGPNTYHCPDCDRTFEVAAPPERVICSDCGNKGVEYITE